MATAELSAEHREIRVFSRCLSSPPIFPEYIPAA